MGLFTFLGGKDSALSEPVRGLYRAAVTAARAPVFYTAHGVPDTPDGRFDMVALHVFLTLRRLKRDGGTTAMALAQALTDLMFADMDRNLRELGVGDLGVGRQVKALAAAFRGRAAAYDAALDHDDQGHDGEGNLATALRRNVFRADAPAETTTGTGAADVLAAYARAADAALAGQATATILSGIVSFPSPPSA